MPRVLFKGSNTLIDFSSRSENYNHASQTTNCSNIRIIRRWLITSKLYGILLYFSRLNYHKIYLHSIIYEIIPTMLYDNYEKYKAFTSVHSIYVHMYMFILTDISSKEKCSDKRVICRNSHHIINSSQNSVNLLSKVTCAALLIILVCVDCSTVVREERNSNSCCCICL